MILQATKLNEGKMHGVQHPGLSPHLSFFKMRKKHLPVFTISLPMSDLTQAYKLQEDLDTAGGIKQELSGALAATQCWDTQQAGPRLPPLSAPLHECLSPTSCQSHALLSISHGAP